MDLAEKEKLLIARYAIVENPHERLAAIVERARKMPVLPETARTEAHRVPGCVSRVWLHGEVIDGLCRFRLDADSTLVKGLAGLLVELYDGASAKEIAAFDATVLEALRFTESLSPTRLHGLAQVRRAIQAFAAAAVPMIDAHNHLHDARLAPHRAEMLEGLTRLGIERAVVNGTRESDWPAVSALAAEVPWVLPSYGLHPWHVRERSPHFLETLSALLNAHPDAAVGEIGLDRWIEGHDLDDQSEVFRAQLALAAERDRAVTIHCIRAWGPLWEILHTDPLPARGFLIHAYGGPWEMTRGFLDRGGYFSFNAYFLHERKAAQREVFRRLPVDRILVETDAPDLAPPPERNPHPLPDAGGRAINHPANLALAYAALAELRGIPLEELTAQVRENSVRLFVERACL